MHKSVTDWLQRDVGSGEHFVLSKTDMDQANMALADYCKQRSKPLIEDGEWKVDMTKADQYAMRHSVAHLHAAGRAAEAGQLMLQFRWLLARVRMGDVDSLVQDARSTARELGNHGLFFYVFYCERTWFLLRGKFSVTHTYNISHSHLSQGLVDL